MSNGSISGLTVLAGGITRVLLALRSSHVCQLQRTINFATARSFVEPTVENKAALQDLLTRMKIPSAHDRLLITGHTDSPGDRELNQRLSERRTSAVQAILQGDPTGTAQWETLFNAEGWDTPELTLMVGEVGETDVNRFRGPSNRAARLDLYQRYFQRLLGGTPVPSFLTTTPPLLACGEDQLLHGDRSSPSRDTSLPPIEGEFRPNRRSEFFFFDATPGPIACSEYPTWTGLCSLTPPAPKVTVTIAPVDTVRKGQTAKVQVTVNPSPLPPGTQVNLTLSTISGTGEVRFADNNAATLTISQSDAVAVRGVTESSVPDNIRLSATVLGQATVLAQEDFTVAEAISIFLQFEVWNLTTHAFEPLPAGVNVDLMDHDPARDDLVATSQTDARGRVFFNLPDLAASGEPNPDIFFLVHTNGLSHASHTLPREWSTKGWQATDGTPGFQPGFTGPSLGTPALPIVFRVGVDFHARFKYLDGRTGRVDQLAPPRIPIEAHSAAIPGGDPPKTSLLTDDNGEVHGVIFNLDPADDFYFHVEFEMTDPTINLPRARVQMDQAGWSTFFSDADQNRKLFDLDRTSIGTQSSPEEFPITVNERNVALYFLKVLREWSTFLFHITGGAWAGVTGLVIFRRLLPFATSSHSFPVGEVHVDVPSHFDRATIIHELSHQIMWQESRITTSEIASLFLRGLYVAEHFETKLTTSNTAFVEGWSVFAEAVFANPIPPFPVNSAGDREVFTNSTATTLLGPPPLNRGESVEGAFAQGLLAIFERHVVTSAVATSPNIPESRNGNIAVPTWLSNAAVRGRFLSMIWGPLQDLRGLGNVDDKTTTAMLDNIRSRNLTDWHKLQPELQAFNMAMVVPTVTGINPTGGPPAGGTPVTITGSNFTLGTTTVTFNGVAATPVNVTGTATLTATTPAGSLGSANVVVTTPAGNSAPFSGFTYAQVPTVSSVTGTPPGTPARGPTTGGTPITITGTDFQVGAKVFLGGLPSAGGVEAPPADVVVISPTQITAKTPLFPLPQHQPGGTAVVVLNPDDQSGSLDPGFDYLLEPAPNITFINPPNGSAAGGDTIVINGLNFQAGVTVLIDGRNADVDAANTTSTQITALTPARPGTTAAVVVNVEVGNPDGQTAAGGFTYTP